MQYSFYSNYPEMSNGLGGRNPVLFDLSSFPPEEHIVSLICTERKDSTLTFTLLIGLNALSFVSILFHTQFIFQMIKL